MFGRSRRSTDELFTVLARRNRLAYPRLGMAISRKHAPQAVTRNRVKRLIREAFRTRQQELAGYDLVILGRHGVGRRRNAELRTSLERHWRRLTA